jgi:GR25 family glycosyltransferase involved in LPS biosynthesis
MLKEDINKFFDNIYCINLDNRKDRWDNISKRFTDRNIFVNRFSAINKPENSRLGCIMSHISIIEDAKKNGYDRILVFEDDCDFLDTFDSNILTKLDDWELFYFGYNSHKEMLVENGLVNINNCYSTHAIAYNESIYDFILDAYYSNKIDILDVWYSENIQNRNKSYGAYPLMIIQDINSYSDIEEMVVGIDHMVERFHKNVKIKTCLYIPTIPEHIKNIPNIIECIKSQTRIPDEVIISVSESELIDSYLLDSIEKSYDVKLLRNIGKFDSAENRNFYGLSDCDLIIYQDSDDLLHKQRVELIESFFIKHNLKTLNHSFTRIDTIQEAVILSSKEKKYKIEDIPFIESKSLYDLYFPNGNYLECNKFTWYSEGTMFNIAAGPISTFKTCLQEVGGFKNKTKQIVAPYINDITHKSCEDFEMCMELLYKYNNSLIINAELYYYVK